MTQDVLAQFRIRDVMETDGAYNPDKIIDVMEYAQTGRSGGANVSGVAYTLGQLRTGAKTTITATDRPSTAIMKWSQCRRPDGSYYYYYLEDFLGRFERGEMRIEFTGGAQDQAGFLERTAGRGHWTDSGGYELRILDREGTELYTDCWNLASPRERYAPASAKNLLEVVNRSSDMNGRLSEIYGSHRHDAYGHL